VRSGDIVLTETARKPGPVEETRASGMTRGMLWVKIFLFFALVSITGYGVWNQGLFLVQRWVPVAVLVLGILFITLFVARYYDDVPRAGWVLIGLLSTLVLVKALSLIWSVGPGETVQEILRSAMYLAIFVVSLASLPNRRQIPWLLDGSVIIVVLVSGYVLLQKVDPVTFPLTSLDTVRASSQLGYPNTAALMIGMGIVLALARMTELENLFVRALHAGMIFGSLVALYYTFSRGGMLTLAVGLAVLFALGRNRLQMFANLALAALPAGAVLFAVRNLEGLTASGVPLEQRVADGSRLQAALLFGLVAAFLLQAFYAALKSRYELVPRIHRLLGAAVLAGVLLAGATGAGMVVYQHGGPGGVWESFTGSVGRDTEPEERLTSLSANQRTAYWAVALEEWRERPLLGTGAGTFLYTWLENREGLSGVRQVHNLYLEQGTETGIVAFLALAGFAVYLTYYAVRGTLGATGGRRFWMAALTAAVVVYLVSSFLEWHWYIPPSTMFFFLLAAAAVKLASRPEWNTPETSGDLPRKER
jgi:hypothetical protein